MRLGIQETEGRSSPKRKPPRQKRGRLLVRLNQLFAFTSEWQMAIQPRFSCCQTVVM